MSTNGSSNNAPLSNLSDIIGEVTLKTSVDGYQLLKVNEMIKNAVAWRARMPKTNKISTYFNGNSKDATQKVQEPKVHINEATLEVMGQASKDFGYTKQEFIEAVEMYQYFGNQNLEDVPIPNSQDFVPHFADLSRPLARLTCKDRVFEWTQECKKVFNILKQNLCAQPILKYADTSKGYTLYTDASRYGWAGVLTQAHTSMVEGKTVTTDHPIAYVSGLFRGSQLNWAALTKEAYAIYMSVKKLAFYLTDADVLLKSDHLPLKKFLQKNTLNNKVNNWAMELEAFNIKFEHVSGKANILADMLSHLINLDPDARLDPENAGWEFGYYIFESLPKLSSADVVQICEILSGKNVIRPDPDVQQPFVQQLRSPLTLDELRALQSQDDKCTTLIRMLKNGKLDPIAYSLHDGVLYRQIVEGGQSFQVIYVPRTPESLIQAILHAAHDEAGHNGFPRTYSAIRRLYYWKGIKEDVLQHCRNCYICQLHKTATVKFEAKHFKPSLKPMDFIAMDLIGEFHPPSSQGNRYALTGVCMLTGFTWCIPIKSKTATDVARAYMQHMYSILGGSMKILTDNGTEFKNEVFREVLQKLGTEKLIHSPPYRPQSNGQSMHR